MSTGSVNPFTPTQPTQAITASTSNQTLSFNPCDAVLVYNANSAPVFVAFGTAAQLANGEVVATVPSAGTPGSTPIPAGAQMLIGTPGITGFDSQPITVIAIIASTGTGDVYVTPGAGTQH